MRQAHAPRDRAPAGGARRVSGSGDSSGAVPRRAGATVSGAGRAGLSGETGSVNAATASSIDAKRRAGSGDIASITAAASENATSGATSCAIFGVCERCAVRPGIGTVVRGCTPVKSSYAVTAQAN